MFSSPVSIGCSFDRVLDKVINSAAGTSHDEQGCFLDRTLQLASLLYKSTKRCIRKRATLQNSISWPLLPELTTKVFSMLDTKSLIQASACCTMFNKCAMDPICYSHIDLTTAAMNVDNRDVCIMIHRAGKELRSIKLGSISLPAGSTSLLTSSCLTPLTFNHCFAGGHLRSLHLYRVMMDCESLYPVLSACSNLTDLKIVGLYRGINHTNHDQLKLLGSVTSNCRLIKHLFIDMGGRGTLAGPSWTLELVNECPNLISLSLVHFIFHDDVAQQLIKGFPLLKYLNLSRWPLLNGRFLRDLGLSCKDSPLETLILRHCPYLREGEVLLFLNSITAGDFESIRLIDVSNFLGLVCDGNRVGGFRTELRLPIEEMKKQRPEVTLVANFGSRRIIDYIQDEEDDYDDDDDDDYEDEDDDGNDDDDDEDDVDSI